MTLSESGGLNELLKAWRKSPDETTTVALCGYLGATLQLGLIGEVGRAAENGHPRNTDVLLAVGRMYLAASMFPPAWRALVQARKSDHRDPRPLKYLAEVLLRQGEAARAAELLQRALEHGVTSSDILTLNEQLVEYIEVEKREGPGAVAARVAGDATHLQLMADGSPVSFRHTPSASEEEETHVFSTDALQSLRGELERERGEFISATEITQDEAGLSSDPVIEMREPSYVELEPEELEEAAAAGLPVSGQSSYVELDSDELDDVPMQGSRAQQEPSYEELDDHELQLLGAPPSSAKRLSASVPAPSLPPFSKSTMPPANRQPRLEGKPFPDPVGGPPPRVSEPLAASLPAPTPPPTSVSASKPAFASVPPPKPPIAASQPPAAPATASRSAAATASLPPASRPVPRPPLKSASNPVATSRSKTIPPVGPNTLHPPSVPADALQFSRDQALGVTGRKAAFRRVVEVIEWPLALAFLATLAFFGYTAWKEQAELAHLDAIEEERLEVLEHLQESTAESLAAAEPRLSALLTERPMAKLELLGLRFCVLRALVAEQACADARDRLARAERLGVPAALRSPLELSLLVQAGNLQKSVALARQLGEASERDPYLAVMVGLVLELTLDREAHALYARARKLDPKLRIASLLEARSTLFKRHQAGTPQEIDEPLEALGPSPEAHFLCALAGLKSRVCEESKPAASDRLMSPARPLLVWKSVLNALQNRKHVAAGTLIERAQGDIHSPFLFGAFGLLAVDAGRLDLARSLASKLEAIDGDEPQAKLIHAKLALARGDLAALAGLLRSLTENKHAKPYAEDVNLLRLVLAYERNDPDGVREVLARVGTDAAMSVRFIAGSSALALFSSEAFPKPDLDALVRSGAFYSDLVGFDAALDRGDLELAEKLVEGWAKVHERPLHLARVARLRRYQGRLRDSIEITGHLLASPEPSERVIMEHAVSLFALGRTKELREFAARYSERIGFWTRTFCDFDRRAVRAVREHELPADAWLDLRMVVARVLTLAKDPRRHDYIQALKVAFPDNLVIRRLSG